MKIKITILLALIIQGLNLSAEDIIKEEIPDKIEIRLGGYFLANQDTNIKISNNGVGANFNLQDLFNMDSSTQVFKIDGKYRFNDTHGIEFSWYSINNSSSTNKDFTWGDKDISSANLKTFYDTDIYKVNYLYSFYHNEKVELGLSAGLHITSINIGFSGEYKNNGDVKIGNESISTTAPLPVIGLRLGYNITPKLNVKFSSDYFFLKFNSFSGTLVDTSLTIDYRIMKHFGLGLGLNSTNNNLNIDLPDNKNLELTNNVRGVSIYGSLNF